MIDTSVVEFLRAFLKERSLIPLHPASPSRFTSGNPNASLPAPATTFGGMESAQAAANAAVAALGVVSVARPTTTLRLNNMLTNEDLRDEAGLGDIEEETKVNFFLWRRDFSEFYHCPGVVCPTFSCDHETPSFATGDATAFSMHDISFLRAVCFSQCSFTFITRLTFIYYSCLLNL